MNKLVSASLSRGRIQYERELCGQRLVAKNGRSWRKH